MTPLYVKRKDVEKMVTLSYDTIYHLEKKGMFPKRRQVTPKRVAWVYSEILEWFELNKLNNAPSHA